MIRDGFAFHLGSRENLQHLQRWLVLVADRLDALRRKKRERAEMGMSGTDFSRASHPVDAVEQVADINKWVFERPVEDEIAISVHGTWTDYNLSFSWMEDFEALHLACAFDMRVPSKRVVETMRLVSLINEQILFGHFEVWVSDGTIMFRHALPLAGGAETNDAQIECLLQSALNSCERYFQAFQFVVWAGKPAAEALDSVLFDTVGEA